MKKYCLSDIDNDLIEYIDRYFKRVIINAKKRYYSVSSKPKQYGFTLCDIDKYMDDLMYYEQDFDRAEYDYTETSGHRIPLSDALLISALKSLSQRQRDILLQNVVLGIPMNDIARQYGLNTRTVEKHKHNALILIKERMLSDAGDYR